MAIIMRKPMTSFSFHFLPLSTRLSRVPRRNKRENLFDHFSANLVIVCPLYNGKGRKTMHYSILIQGSPTNGSFTWINPYKYKNPTITSMASSRGMTWNARNPKSPLRPPQLVPWFLRFIRISALMSKTRVLKCAISMTIMVVIAGQCDHFQPWRETRRNQFSTIFHHFPPFSAIFYHCLPGHLDDHGAKSAKIHFLSFSRGNQFSVIFGLFLPFSAIACLVTSMAITRNARKPMAANFGKFLQC